MTQVDYVDASGHVTVAEDKGYATVRYKYNGNNQVTEIAYYDAQGQLVSSDKGYARMTQDWNSKR